MLLNKAYQDFLLAEGIGEWDPFMRRCSGHPAYRTGRKPLLSVPLPGGQRMILRRFWHGGLLRAFTRGLYLFGARAFQELLLTEEIRSCGVSTVQPIGAIHRRVLKIFYHPYLLSLEIPGSMDLAQYFRTLGPKPAPGELVEKRKALRSAGLLLRQFHQAGFFHKDLQLKNILIAGDRLFLIDFDRSYRKQVLSVREKMKNILRLNRSVEKWKRAGLSVTKTDRWRFFSAYAGDDQEIVGALRKAMRTYSIRCLFYRFGWAVDGIAYLGKRFP